MASQMVLVVDDDSTDRTAQIVGNLAGADPGVMAHRGHGRRLGGGRAGRRHISA